MTSRNLPRDTKLDQAPGLTGGKNNSEETITELDITDPSPGGTHRPAARQLCSAQHHHTGSSSLASGLTTHMELCGSSSWVQTDADAPQAPQTSTG